MPQVKREKCGKCKFWLKNEAAPADAQDGLCRRYPPALTLANVRMLKDGSQTEMTTSWQFPPMFAFGWCGEFKEV